MRLFPHRSLCYGTGGDESNNRRSQARFRPRIDAPISRSIVTSDAGQLVDCELYDPLGVVAGERLAEGHWEWERCTTGAAAYSRSANYGAVTAKRPVLYLVLG